MKRFRVMVRDRKGGSPEVLEAFEAKTKDEAVARLNLAGMAVESIFEVEQPREPKAPSRMLAKVRGGAARAWGSMDKQGKSFVGAILIVVLFSGVLFVLQAAGFPPPRSESRANDRFPTPARTPVQVPREEVGLPIQDENRSSAEVWRNKSVWLVKGDVIAPGVTLLDMVFYVRSVAAEGAKCKAYFLIENVTGMDVSAGTAVVWLMDDAGATVWRCEPQRVRVEESYDRELKNLLSQEIFVPPSEWKQAKRFGVLFSPAR